MHYVTFGTLPSVDSMGRPKQFYAKRVHDSCYRRAYFDAGLFAESFDSHEARQGHCLYKLGCRGPLTYNACGSMEWNNGLSYPIKSGNPCIGCSSNHFWDNDPFTKRLEDIPGFGIEAAANTVGKVVLGAAIGGTVVHAVAANFARKKDLRSISKKGKEIEKDIQE